MTEGKKIETMITDIAVLQDNVQDLKACQAKIMEHETRLSLTELVIKESREAQEKILANTEEIKAQQQEMAKTLSLLQLSNKNQWREIDNLKENFDLKTDQKDFTEYKEATDKKLSELQKRMDARIKWLIAAFFTLVSVVTGILALVK